METDEYVNATAKTDEEKNEIIHFKANCVLLKKQQREALFELIKEFNKENKKLR